MGLVVLATVLAMTGCMGVPKWDKAATEVSTLYIEESWSIIKLDGAGKFFVYGDQVYKGNGLVNDPDKPSDRDLKRLKPVLEIPSGERVLTIQYSSAIDKTSKDVTYTFLPGKHYAIYGKLDMTKYNIKDALKQDISIIEFVVQDITDLKVKK